MLATIVSFLLKHWKAIFFIGALVGLLFAVQSCKKYQDEYLNAKDNYEAELKEAAHTNQKQRLHTKEIKRYYEQELDVLRDSLAIKPKQVTKLQILKTVEHDTIVSVIKESLKFNDLHVASFKKGCTNGSFVWVDGDSLGTFTITNNNSFIIADHWQRQRLFGWKWTPRWGRKKGQVSVVNTCNNDTIVENKVIEIR